MKHFIWEDTLLPMLSTVDFSTLLIVLLIIHKRTQILTICMRDTLRDSIYYLAFCLLTLVLAHWSLVSKPPNREGLIIHIPRMKQTTLLQIGRYGAVKPYRLLLQMVLVLREHIVLIRPRSEIVTMFDICAHLEATDSLWFIFLGLTVLDMLTG